MDTNHDEILRICENPLEAKYDVWKRRETLKIRNYRSRRKGTGVEDTLITYSGAAKEMDADSKGKERPIDYTYIDEYCKVSTPKPSEEEDSRPRKLKTNTAFGRSRPPFSKFARTHLGGAMDFTLTEPVVAQPRCHQVDTRIRRSEGSSETAPGRDNYETDDVPLKCCGHNVETAVDYCTCMFCVKGLFYHCTKDSSSETALAEPCSCSPTNGCVKRWCILGVLAIFLPCLLCYPMARGCTEVCKCYKKQQETMKGCQSGIVQNHERVRLT